MHESARPDLCGGPRATGVPTAMVMPVEERGLRCGGMTEERKLAGVALPLNGSGAYNRYVYAHIS